MAYETIIYTEEDGLGTITLHRPDRLNALSRQLIAELTEIVHAVRENDDIRVLIFTGAPRSDGRPCFSAGVDLKEVSQLPHEDVMLNAHRISTLFNEIEDLPKPTIGAIDGICTAGGLELALTFDIRIVSTTAEIRDLHIKNLGGMGRVGLPARLPRLVGLSWAKELCWTGNIVDGPAAVGIGLANHCYAPDKLMEEARKLGKQIGAMRPLSVTVHKECFNRGIDMSLHEAMHFSDVQYERLGGAEKRAAAYLEGNR